MEGFVSIIMLCFMVIYNIINHYGYKNYVNHSVGKLNTSETNLVSFDKEKKSKKKKMQWTYKFN